ncbi:hypothetical protein A5636_13415 [Mycobacterium asiaticum]|uniref:PE domain-containing protein n=2 Tax=Mycobacterium asiaticum TaxID=1790 RepID=A0A1A3MRP3_MYCAS|nr:hypothetical protein A5636_13415 [Mycobacterium asiaticum]
MAIASVFGMNAQQFQGLSARAAAFHEEFVKLLSAGATQYLNTEVANAQQVLQNAVNAPAQVLLGHPLAAAGQGAGAANPADTSPSISLAKGGFLGFSYDLSTSGFTVSPYGNNGIQASLTGSLTLGVGPFSWAASVQEFAAADDLGIRTGYDVNLGGYGLQMYLDRPTGGGFFSFPQIHGGVHIPGSTYLY